jgi:hypothetical protein
MVNAPTFGKPVRTAWYRWDGDAYLGATRPAAEDGAAATPDPAVPAAPDPAIPDDPDFRAPAAPPLVAPTASPAPQPAEAGSTAFSATAARRTAHAAPVTPRPVPVTRAEGARPAAPAPTTGPAPSRPSRTPPPTTSPATSPAPTADPVPAADPSTAPPTTGTTGSPTAPVPAPRTLVDASRTVGLAGATSRADGLPSVENGWVRTDRWLVRLAVDVDTTVGGVLHLDFADGNRETFTVAGRTRGAPEDLAAVVGALVIVTPDADGTWTIVSVRRPAPGPAATAVRPR